MINGRVEVIPAERLWSSLLCNVGASTYLFIMEETIQRKPREVNLDIFTNAYAVAGNKNHTDLFTTREIQQMISDHNGEYYNFDEISLKLTELGYMSALFDKKPMWMVKDKVNEHTVLLLENGKQ